MEPVLFYTPGTCALACMVALEWRGAPYSVCLVGREERASDRYRAINPRAQVPALRVDGVKVDSRGTGAIEATFFAAKGGAELDSATVEAVIRDGRVVRGEVANATSGRIRFPLEGLPRGKTVLTLRARSRDGAEAEPALATAWVEGRPFDARDTVLYQVVVDRFRGDTGPLAPPATPSDRAGGTLRGVTRAIEDGTIAGLGANAIWISPVYTNPEGKFSGNDGRSYSSYHQYWPTDPRGVDARIGGEAALDELVRTAHARGIRVLFDVVPNHVHETHPYAKVPGFTQGSASCVCGQRDCDWATKIDTCWFAPYLPDLDWSNGTGTTVSDSSRSETTRRRQATGSPHCRPWTQA